MFRCPALLASLALLALAPSAIALDATMVERVRAMAQAAARLAAPPDTRVVVETGQLDPRLRLAPCAEVQPFLPPGLAMWGRSRVGLRCVDGPSRWSVTLPVQVRVFGRAVVASQALPAGLTIAQEHLALADIDIAAEPGAVFTDPAALLGRSLSRPLNPAEVLRQPHLKARQWFAAGETVQIVASGPGFAIGTQGQALSAGLEGQDVRVRVDSGRVLSARPIAERRVELLL